MSSEIGPFTPIPHTLAQEVGLVCAAVYGAVWRHCQMKEGVCRASLDTLGADINIDRATVMRNIKKLCELGYLSDQTPDRRNAPHTYTLAKTVALCNTSDNKTVVTRNSSEDETVAERNKSVAYNNSFTETVAESKATVAESNLNIVFKETPLIQKEEEEKKEIPVFENPQTTDSRWAKIWQLWGDNIHLSESPVVIDEMQQDQYLGCPFEWWQQTITIMARNRVYTWNYARSILDRSIEAKESPDILGPPATKYDKNSARQGNQSPRQPKVNKAPLPPTPDADLPAPAPPLPPHVAVWQQVKDVLKAYAILADVEARASPNGTLILVASPPAKEWIEGRLKGKILETAKLFKPEIHKLEVLVQ